MLSACVNGHTHNLEYHAAQAPTCSEKGHKEYWQCTVCGGLFGDEAMTILYGNPPLPRPKNIHGANGREISTALRAENRHATVPFAV